MGSQPQSNVMNSAFTVLRPYMVGEPEGFAIRMSRLRGRSNWCLPSDLQCRQTSSERGSHRKSDAFSTTAQSVSSSTSMTNPRCQTTSHCSFAPKGLAACEHTLQDKKSLETEQHTYRKALSTVLVCSAWFTKGKRF